MPLIPRKIIVKTQLLRNLLKTAMVITLGFLKKKITGGPRNNIILFNYFNFSTFILIYFF